MERHSLQISRRLYPGQVDAIPMQLPPSYVSEKKNNLITGQNCSNCFFINGGKCEYWEAKFRNDYRWG